MNLPESSPTSSALPRRYRKRRWRRTIALLLLIGGGGWLFRGILFRSLVAYEVVGNRPGYTISDPEFSHWIDEQAAGFTPRDVQDIIRLSLRMTDARLRFRSSQPYHDPNRLFRSRRAHCVGYAAFFTAVCNELLRRYGYDREWEARSCIARIYGCGINLHPFFTSPFFRDHDFNRIENKRTGRSFYVDAVAGDYLRITYMRVR